MCVSWRLSVLPKIFILLLKSLQWLPSICKCSCLIPARTLQKFLMEPTHTSAFHIAFWPLSCWRLFPLECWYCCKPIRTSVTFTYVPFYTSRLGTFNSKTSVVWVSLYCFHAVIGKKKIEVGDFLSAYKFPFTALKTSSSKSWWNQDSYWPLRRKVRGQDLPCVYRRAPQKILSYNSEDYASSDFFFFSRIGLAKSFFRFSSNIVLKNLNELLGQPDIFMVLKGATSASPAYLTVPWAGGSPERALAHRLPKQVSTVDSPLSQACCLSLLIGPQ